MQAARALLAVVTVGCGGSNSPSQGEAGGHCYPNGTCNVSLSCIGGFCAPTLDAPIPDARLDAAHDGQLDATPDARFCADDSAFEGAGGNDTVGTAYAVPDLSTQSSCLVTYASLAICPAGDRDYYAVVVNADGKSIQADVTYSSGAALLGVITNGAGTPIKTLAATGTPNMISATATNLPSGTYYTEVYGSTGINNYSMTLSLTPCP